MAEIPNKIVSVIGDWGLEFVWSLGFAIWNFKSLI